LAGENENKVLFVKISGILSIRDGVYLGYPFLEAILSLIPIVDEFLIGDGGSKDETLHWLRKLKKIFPKIKIYHLPWFKSKRWEALDESLNYLIKKAKGDWIFEVQGDELWHEKDILKIREIIKKAHRKSFNSIRQPCLGCSWTNIDFYIYKTVRIVRKISGLKSCWGGDDFQIGESRSPKKGFTSHNVPPELEIKIPFYHFNRLFLKNILLQDKVFVDFLATEMENRKEIFERHKEMYRDKFNPPRGEEVLDSLPAIIKGLSQDVKYRARKELFDRKLLSKITGLNY